MNHVSETPRVKTCAVRSHTRTIREKPNMWESEAHQQMLSAALVDAVDLELQTFSGALGGGA